MALASCLHSHLPHVGKSGWTCGQLEKFPGKYKREEREEKQNLLEAPQGEDGAA